ncbi:MAG: sigma-54 interaction domain-containing protein [Pseudohongiellaceae bacterium]
MIEPIDWIVDSSPEQLALLDTKLKVITLSGSLRENLKINETEYPEASLESLLGLTSHQSLTTKLNHLCADGIPIENLVVQWPDSSTTLRATLSAWKITNPIDGWSGFMVLIKPTGYLNQQSQEPPSRQPISQELQQLRSQHQLILDSAGEGIWGLDSAGRITFGNRAAVEILGWELESVLGKSSHDIHHHSHEDGTPYPKSDCPIYASLQDGEVHHVDHEVFWHTDGSAIPVEYVSTPIMTDGKLNGAVIVFKDISERKEIEQQRTKADLEIRELKEKLEQERDYLRDEVNYAGNFGEIIGDSSALRRTQAQVEAVATTTASVLVLGESGVGKEMVARAIHTRSNRSDKALVKVNCASIPTELFESEFFGHVKGAFTSAHQDRIGRLQLADGGTLFLDEVGEIPLVLQSKLLRALQENEFERVGDHQTIKVNVRVIAATNRDLSQEVRAGKFREDLFYRLSVFPIEVPPLRARKTDIYPLAMNFLSRACKELGKEPIPLTQGNVKDLVAHSWPGNIRELKNSIERAVISSNGRKLQFDLPTANTNKVDYSVPSISSAPPISKASGTFLTHQEFRKLEKENIMAALNYANWKTWGNQGAAKLLGIKPSTLAYQIKQMGIQKPSNTSDN